MRHMSSGIDRTKLYKKAEKLGIEFSKHISTKKLIALIDVAKASGSDSDDSDMPVIDVKAEVPEPTFAGKYTLLCDVFMRDGKYRRGTEVVLNDQEARLLFGQNAISLRGAL